MTHQDALLMSAVEACIAIDKVLKAGEAKADSFHDVVAARVQSAENFRVAFVGIMSSLADAAFAGDVFSRAWITEAFGDNAHDTEGEEFGGYKTLPTRAVVGERINAVTGQMARSILRNIAEQPDCQ